MKKEFFLSSCLLFLSFVMMGQSYIPERNNQKIKVKPVIAPVAYAFNLKDVRLLDGSPFKHAMEKDAAYLLLLEPKRLLHRFYKNAGLSAADSVYGGWESAGLSGHTLGHYLSAAALMYASTDDARFKDRVNFIVDELEKCQQARKTGYVGAIPNEDSIFGKLSRGVIKTGGFDLNGGWSPWYTVHKVMAGLLDAYLYCDNAKALAIASRMADWTANTLQDLNAEQLQKMLTCEYGGMNDVLANLYSITGNKKYLDLSYKFYDDFVMKPLSQKADPMAGKHSNTNVPKAIGSARQYELTGNASDKTIASFFWDIMVHRYSYVIGGNSNYEYCTQPFQLNNALSDNTCETCCTYNMLKLTRHLFSWEPNSALTDYYERALYNHILASQNPDNGMMCYFVPLRMGTRKEFSDSFNTFTCCVGSGLENHSKYSEAIYAEGADGSLFVNLFIPSVLNWKQKNVKIKQVAAYPENGNITLEVSTKAPQSFSVRVRHPWWTRGPVMVKINGKAITSQTDATGYIVITRSWKNNDRLALSFPMSIYTEAMPDNKDRIAIMYGPLVLAGQLGDTLPDPVYGTPVLLTDKQQPSKWLKPVVGKPLEFTTLHAGKPFDVKLVPFYKTVNQYYNVYWDYFTKDGWTARAAAYEADKKKQQAIAARTIDNMRLGEMQPERDHQLQASENSYTSTALGRSGREARKGGYFSFDMKVQPDISNVLLCSYLGDDKHRAFDILIDSTKLCSVVWDGGDTGKFYDVEYAIPAAILKGKTKVRISIEAVTDKTAGRIFGCSILKAQ